MTTLEGGILAEKGEWASLAKDLGAEKGISKQYKPPTDHVRHLKPLYVKVVINGRPISQAFFDNGVFLNKIPFSLVKKLVQTRFDWNKYVDDRIHKKPYIYYGSINSQNYNRAENKYS